MNCKTSKLRDAIVVALVLGAGTTSAAFAQEAASTSAELDRVEVTGSRIRSADVETAQPVFSIGRQQIQQQGFTSVVDILQNISSSGSPPISRSAVLSSGENVGGNYIDLRNLGANRTLILVNGKRLGITTSGLQDISAIPTAMVERIDVLKDGASSVYGSDAIAGVVNIITRKDYDGFEASVYTGQYSEGDGAKHNVNMVLGFAGDRGSLTVGADYRKEEEVWAKDRWFSRVTYPEFSDTAGLTSVGQYGNFSYNGVWYVANRPGDATDMSDFHPQAAYADYSNANEQMHLISPLTTRTVYLSGNYDLTDSIRFTTDIGYSSRSATRQIAGYPLQSSSTFGSVAGWYLSGQSYFNPVDTNVRFRRRGWEVPRVTTSDSDTLRFTAGLEGSFELGEHYFDWDVGGMYSNSDLLQVARGDYHIPNVVAATGPSFMNGQGVVQCGTPANPIPLTQCVPWNPLAGFGAGTIANSLEDPAVQKFLFPTTHSRGTTTTTNFFANLSGLLFTLPAGDLTFAVGAEYREEKGAFTPDALAQSGSTSTLAAGPTSGDYHLTEYYAELNVPILADIPGIQELSVNLASRYSDYSTFGDTTNSKIGIKWKPIDSLLLRGTWSEGFRAPTISNLYGGGSQTFTTGFIDPCDSVYGAARGTPRCLQDVPANYRQLQQGFIPTTGAAAQTPVPFFSGSNPLLQPEVAKTKTAGVVWSPGFAEGLNVTVDWWNIRIDDTMVSDSPNAILSDCYIGLIESRCAMFERDPTLHIVNQLSFGLRNAGFTETEGFDVGLNYRIGTGLGDFGVNWDTTYVSKYDQKATNDATAPVQPYVGFGSYFRTRSNFGLNWSKGIFGATWGMRYYSGTKEQCIVGTTDENYCNIQGYSAPWTQGKVVKHNHVGSVTFNDLQFRVKTPWNAQISVGANNVFDRQGPIMYTQPNSNFSYYGGYDIGRFWYMKYEQTF